MQNWNIKITTCKFLWYSPPFSFSLPPRCWNNGWLCIFSVLLLLDLVSALFTLLCPSNWPKLKRQNVLLSWKDSVHTGNYTNTAVMTKMKCNSSRIPPSPFYFISSLQYSSSANTYTQWDVTNKQKRQKQMTKEIGRASYQVHCMHISLLLIGDTATYNPIVIKK